MIYNCKIQITVLLSLLFISCSPSYSPEQKAMVELTRRVNEQIRCDPGEIFYYAIAPLDEGYAVAMYWNESTFLTGDEPQKADTCLLYWVAGENVFAINSKAKECSPHLAEGPPEITSERTMKAILHKSSEE